MLIGKLLGMLPDGINRRQPASSTGAGSLLPSGAGLTG
jgi:hypothetical protein